MNVSNIEVGKYYLKAELSKLLPEEEVRPLIEQKIDGLSEDEFWRLLEALSFTWRLNGVFWVVGNTKYKWMLKEWEAKDILFLQINSDVDKVSFSEEIQGDPLKFSNYLKKYFAKHPDDDPEKLGQFRLNTDREVVYDRLFVIDDGKKPYLFDGGNRLIAQLLRGETKIKTYTAIIVNPQGSFRVGESSYMLLNRIDGKASEGDKSGVKQTIKAIAQSDANREHVPDYIKSLIMTAD